jgi:phosphocarrier protein HPr
MNRRGLHARAAAKMVKTSSLFSAEIIVLFDCKEVLATSIMGLMFLGATHGSIITLKATGPEATDALNALKHLVEENFFEE